MTEPRTCGNCGARPSKTNARFCEYCGTELPPLPTSEPAAGRGEEAIAIDVLERRFAALESHPSIRDLMDYTPRTVNSAVSLYGGAVASSCFLLVSLGLLFAFLFVFPPLAIVPLFFIVLGAVGLAKNLQRATEYTAAPLERHPAVILDERTEFSSGGEEASASTSYFLILQFPDGRRSEHAVDGHLAGALTQGDLGIAYLKSEALVDFQRVKV